MLVCIPKAPAPDWLGLNPQRDNRSGRRSIILTPQRGVRLLNSPFQGWHWDALEAYSRCSSSAVQLYCSSVKIFTISQIDSLTENRTSEMSGFTKQTQLPPSVKQEIKEEEFDDFLQEYLSAIQKVEGKPGLEHECKTESERSPTLACKEEKS